VRGALSIALRARENGIKNLLIPEENATEAAVVSGIDVYPIKDLREAVELCRDLQADNRQEFRL
jgi:magnesium chelatase family protein